MSLYGRFCRVASGRWSRIGAVQQGLVAALGLPPHKVRVGTKATGYPEDLLVPVAALACRRPVKWIEPLSHLTFRQGEAPGRQRALASSNFSPSTGVPQCSRGPPPGQPPHRIKSSATEGEAVGQKSG